MRLTVKLIAIATPGLLFLGACSSSNQTTTTSSSPAANPTASPAVSSTPKSQPTVASSSPDNHPKHTTSAQAGTHGGQGGQIIESGPYHLELLTINEANGTHIDFFLQKGDAHVPIPNAKVTAQVQLPDGTQKTLALKYDAPGKHYYAELPSTAAGEYKVAILTDIQGEKVNARYTFKR